MARKNIIIVSMLFCSILQLGAINNCIPLGLSDLSTSSVYSIQQDKLGAIWLNTSIGLFRYNGNKLESMHTSMPWHNLAYNGDDYIYAPTLRTLCRFDLKTSRVDVMTGTDLSLETSFIIAEADSVIVALDNKILVGRDDTLHLRMKLPEDYVITSLVRLPSGQLLAGTSSKGLVLIGESAPEEYMSLDTKVMALYLESDYRLWVGLYTGGFFCIDVSTGEILCRYDSCNSRPFRQVRSFASDSRNNLYVGAVNGLFRLTPSGELVEESLGGRTSSPVCGLFVDRDDNLWTGTYYSGVFYANVSSYPFINVNLPENASMIRSLTQDSRGDVWMLTDNYGMWQYSSGQWLLKKGTYGIKFQGSFYDGRRDLLWAGDYSAPMLRYDLSTGRVKRYPFELTNAANTKESVASIVRDGTKMYLGGTYGLYEFDPEAENVVSRAIPGLEARIFDLEIDGDGTLWIASQGLYKYVPGGMIQPVAAPEGSEASWSGNIVSGISIDARGRLWLALVGGRFGVVCYDPVEQHADFYGTENCGLADNHTAYVVPISERSVLVGTVSGLSILDFENYTCFNYGHDNGLNFRSARGGAALVLEDGSVIAGGGDGLALLPADFLVPGVSPITIEIDAMHVNGERFDNEVHLPFAGELVLGPEQNDFSFDVASFDYTGVFSTTYEYCLEGFDKGWTRFDISDPVTFMNMAPGHYTFRVRASRSGGEYVEDAVRLTLKPYWYATTAFRILLFLLIFGSAAFVLYTVWTRMMLSERLKRQEQENVERMKFFVDISYQLRTPLNLIIGQIERFFKDFGSRTKGVENIEDVYVKAKKMRELISEFVDKENDELEKTVEDPTSQTAIAAKDAKFLNAAIGAVERNLFTQNLDVHLLCAELNVGKTTLTARLKAACGQTPQVFIEDIRLKHAAQMLSDGNYRVAEVSDILGFSSPKYFSTRFKKKFGCNPSDYCRTSDEK